MKNDKIMLPQRISPRVQALELRGKYTNEPFSREEFEAVLFALKSIEKQVPDAANRLMDDSARYALDTLIETI